MGPYSIFGCPNGLDGIIKKKDALNGKFKLCLSMILLSMTDMKAKEKRKKKKKKKE